MWRRCLLVAAVALVAACSDAAPEAEMLSLQEIDLASRPPAPVQWGLGDEPIPSNRWWSSAVYGPGATSLWPQPLMVRIDGGTVRIAAPPGEVLADGAVTADYSEAVALELGLGAATRVVDHGPLHVRLRVGDAELTLVSGSPVVEIEGSVRVRVPGLGDVASEDGVTRFGTAQGEWLVTGDVEVGVDSLSFTGRVALGPVPSGAGRGYDEAVREVAEHRLVSTEERLSVADDGTTTQELVQERDGGGGSLWALQPHHQQYAVDTGRPFGEVPSVQGRVPVVAGSVLRVEYPAVPIMWTAEFPEGAERPTGGLEEVPVEGTGSYFGGKEVYAYAAQADVLRNAGNDAEADRGIAEVRERIDRLVAERLRWEPTWGSVIVTPAEFGSDTELNDHQLQYGYWVAAASHVAEVDAEAADRYRAAVDLLVADYAGASVVPGAPGTLPAERTWSAYEGHSWASGTANFDAGNNLESISESSFSWWAAARWFRVTGRAELAEPFIARFTIETYLTGFWWLPQGDQLPEDESVRPWSGVVWSGKIDLTTWFDPSPEAALGIRLLPLSPASVSRYATEESVEAAERRWQWCGDACTTMWSNLLGSDAIVAGRRPSLETAQEPSTSALLSEWWEAVRGSEELIDAGTHEQAATVRRTPVGGRDCCCRCA